MVIRTRLLAIGGLICASCTMQAPELVSPEVFQRDIAAPKARVLAAATRVFAEHGLTIAASDTAVGMVQTQPLRVTGAWDDQRVTDRVDCGKDMVGVEHASTNPVTVILSVLVDSAGVGARARLKAQVSTYDHVARSTAATNPIAAGLSGDRGCTLKAAFATRLLDEIGSLATR